MGGVETGTGKKAWGRTWVSPRKQRVKPTLPTLWKKKIIKCQLECQKANQNSKTYLD